MSNLMLTGTDTERLQNMMEMFDLDVFDRLLALTDTRIKVQRANLQNIEGLEEELQSIVVELRGYASVAVLAERMNEAVARRSRLEQEHEHAVQQLDALQERIRGVGNRDEYITEIKEIWRKTPLRVENPGKVDPDLVESLRTETEETEAEAASLRASREDVRRREIIETRLSGLEPVPNCAGELRELRDSLSEMQHRELPDAEACEEARGDIARIPAETRRRETEYDSVAARSKELTRTEGKLQGRLEETAKQLASGICPTCKRPLDMNVADAAALRTEQTEIREKLVGVTAARRDTDRILADLVVYRDAKRRLASVRTRRGAAEIQTDIGRLRSREKMLQASEQASEQRKQLEAQLEAIPALSGADLEARITEAETKLRSRRDQHEAAVAITDRLRRIMSLPQGDLNDLRSRASALQQQLLRYGTEISETSALAADSKQAHDRASDLVRRKEKIEAAVEKSRHITNRLASLVALKFCFGSKGLKQDRFRSILHDAARTTVPAYTQLFWPRRNVELDLIEKGASVRFGLSRLDGPDIGSRLLSGGERSKAGMALLFGLRDLKERYTGSSSNVLILDEPSGNLDAMGIDRLLQVLLRLRSRFSTIIVIGNHSDVLTSNVWDQVWWSVRENNVARLYLSDPPRAATRAATLME